MQISGAARIEIDSGQIVALPPEDLPPNSELEIPDTDWARNFIRLAREVVSAIREGRNTVPGAATFEDGHRNQMVLDAIRASSERGDWVPVGS